VKLNETEKQPEVLARVRRSNSFRTAEESGEVVNNYAMITLGIAAFSAGLWAIVCLSMAIFDQGPLSMLKQLAEALMGK